MGRYAKLSYTSNPKLQEYVGHEGELLRNEQGGYDFVMKDIDKTIRTTASRQGTVLGDVDNPICRNIGFQTRSGTQYSFEFMDVEKLHNGVRRDGNHFLGFDKEYKVGDKVYTDAGHKGTVLSYNPHTALYLVECEMKNGNGLVRFCNSFGAKELRPDELTERLNDASQRANDFNGSHNDFLKGSVEKDFGY